MFSPLVYPLMLLPTKAYFGPMVLKFPRRAHDGELASLPKVCSLS